MLGSPKAEASVALSRSTSLHEAHLVSLAENAFEALVIHDLGIALAANSAFAELLGIDTGAVQGSDLRVLIDTTDPDKLATVLAAPGPPVEIACARSTGDELVVEARGRSLVIDGRPLHMLALRDVTAHRRTVDALLRSRRHLEAAQCQARLGSWEFAPETGRRSWSPEMFRLLGLDPTAEIPSLTDRLQLVHPEDREAVAAYQRAALEGKPASARYRTNPDRGPVRHLESEARPLLRDSQTETHLLGTVRDISDHVDRERALRERETRFRALIENAHDACTMFNADGTLRYISPAIQRVLGWKPEELIGRPGLELVHPDDREAAGEVFARSMSEPGQVIRQTHRLRHADGSYRQIAITGRNLLDDPAIGAIVTNLRDVSEQYALEAMLRQAQKMEAIGQLTGGIAHDFNNLLTVILGVAELIERRIPVAETDVRQDIAQIRAAALRGADMVRKLLAFSRKEGLQLATVDIARLCDETASMLRTLLPETVGLEVRNSGEPSTTHADRGAVQQILINLATNARDAMPEGGSLTVSVSSFEPNDRFLAFHGDFESARYVRLAVTDTGVGMSPEVQQSLFNPFFTTKSVDKGTGLGMSMVYGLVKQHGGQVEVESAPGKGTTVSIYLPASDGEEEVVAEEIEAVIPAAGVETILLAEDNDQLRALAKRVLEAAGYRVFAVADGEEALAVLEAGEPEVDLVVSDVVMPRLDGHALCQRARQAGCEAPFLFTSGYSDFTHGAIETDGVAFGILHKPWSPKELERSVRDLLERGAGTAGA